MSDIVKRLHYAINRQQASNFDLTQLFPLLKEAADEIARLEAAAQLPAKKKDPARAGS